MPGQDVDIAAWLRDLGLERYAPSFLDAEVTAAALAELTDADLRELGLPLGPRKLVLRAIRDMAGLTEPARPETAGAPAPPGAERRQLTVMFVDLVGSTALSQELELEDLRELIGAYHAGVAATVEGHGGFVATKGARDSLKMALREDRLAHITPPCAVPDRALRARPRAPPGCAPAASRPVRRPGLAAPTRRERPWQEGPGPDGRATALL